MSSYPLLADEVERTINSRIRESEVKTKDQLRALSAYQLAYMNTNHEDFIGFNKYVPFLLFFLSLFDWLTIAVPLFSADPQNSNQVAKQKLGNQVISSLLPVFVACHIKFLFLTSYLIQIMSSLVSWLSTSSC